MSISLSLFCLLSFGAGASRVKMGTGRNGMWQEGANIEEEKKYLYNTGPKVYKIQKDFKLGN